MQIINVGPHLAQTQGLVPVLAPNGEMMWVHPDLTKGEQWIRVTFNKKKRTGKNVGNCVISLGTGEYNTSIVCPLFQKKSRLS